MKLKNKGSAKKRVRLTGTGKVVVKKAGRGHLLAQKSKRAKKRGNNPLVLGKGDRKAIMRMLPNL